MIDDEKIIIGSGLCGPLLTILLAQRGYKIKLFEKRQDIRKSNTFSGRSINLALSHRGIEALKYARIFDEVKPHLIPMKGRMIHHQDGRLDFQPYSINPKDYINSVSRTTLNKILLNKADESDLVKIYFNYDLCSIDEEKNRLNFSNGNSISFSDHVFGADGSNSILRNFIDKKVPAPSFIKPLEHSYKELNILSNEEDNFQLEPNALHIWPRGQFMLIALPNTDHSFTCTLFMPKIGRYSFESLKTNDIVINFFEKYFSDVLPTLENFPNQFFENPQGKLGTVYAEHWQYNNQFCLVGDSAHAIVPFFGQGMNASFEDCQILVESLDTNYNNWETLFEDYNIKRKNDGHAIAKMALENYTEMRDLVAKKEFILKKKIANKLYKLHPDRFIPRYNMVSFTSISYSDVYKRGNIQNEIISKLTLDNPNYNQASEMITNRLEPII